MALSRDQLLEWIPHRPPLLWIDKVLSVTEQKGTCSITLNTDGHYMSRSGLRSSTMIEFVAQCFGFVRAAQYLEGMVTTKSAPPTKVFLVAVNNARYNAEAPWPQAGDTIHIHVRGIREFGPLALLEGEVTTPDGLSLFCTQMKVFAE